MSPSESEIPDHAALAARRIAGKMLAQRADCVQSVLNGPDYVGGADPIIVLVARGKEAQRILAFVNRAGAPREIKTESGPGQENREN